MGDDLLIIILLIGINAFTYGFIAFFWWWENRKDFTTFLERTNNGWRKVGDVRSDAKTPRVRCKNKTFELPTGGYIDKGKLVRHIDYKTGTLLSFDGKTNFSIKPEDYDSIIQGHYLKDLLTSLRPLSAMGILFIILPIVCVIGGIALGYLLGSQQTHIITENVKTVTRTIVQGVSP